MREILFRGKRIGNGEWVEGFYYQAKLYRSDKELCHYITTPHPECVGQSSDDIMIDPETVGQYTGMTDMNGKKIFEGDVVKFTTNRFDISDIGVVCFNKGAFCVKYTSWGKMEFHRIGTISEFQDMGARFNLTYQYAVLGNICDNPELLKGE